MAYTKIWTGVMSQHGLHSKAGLHPHKNLCFDLMSLCIDSRQWTQRYSFKLKSWQKGFQVTLKHSYLTLVSAYLKAECFIIHL